MKYKQTNRLKALFLLLVFSLNTVAGFACSVGIMMGYNAHHHEHHMSHLHMAGTGHHHKHAQEHNPLTAKLESPKDDCCANDVSSFALLDKSVSQSNLNLQPPVFLLAFTAAFLSQTENVPIVAVNFRFQFVRRSCFLNDTDLRIAIHSYQI